MTCRHRNIVNEAFLSLGEWGTFRRCRDCKEVVPLGPANDTRRAEEELVAIAIAENPMGVDALWLEIEAAFSPIARDVLDLSKAIGKGGNRP